MSFNDFLVYAGFIKDLKENGWEVYSYTSDEDEEDNFLLVRYDEYNEWVISSFEEMQEFIEEAIRRYWVKGSIK